MSDAIKVLLMIVLFFAGIYMGYHEGKWAADRWYYEHCLHVSVAPDDSDATHEFGGYISGPQGCSDDGRTWWPAHIHQDGTIECLASDKPAPYARKP